MTEHVTSSETEELNRRLLIALREEWQVANRLHFRGQLQPPVFELSEGASHLGRWHLASRTIALQRQFILQEPWPRVREVLKHEMAHQYVHEVLGVLDEPAHGPAFRKVCQARGLDAAAHGIPDVAEGSDEHRVLRKVEKLLSLAQSSNHHEAQAAMQTAQQVLARHNLDLARQPTSADYQVRWLGAPSQRVPAHEKVLAGVLSEHFLVGCIYVQAFLPESGRMGMVLEIFGPRTNVEIAAYVYDFMLRTAERLWNEDKRARGERSDRDRRSYLTAVMAGFAAQLKEKQTADTQKALVLLRHAGLDTFMAARFPRRRSLSSASWQDNEAAQRGHEAGRNVVVHKGMAEGPSPAALNGPRALPARSRG